MQLPELEVLQQLDKSAQQQVLLPINQHLESLSAEGRMSWAMAHLPANLALTSSFGIQAAVCLHLVTRYQRDIPVIFTDTGYLFPETYQFVDRLTEQLQLNLQIYRAEHSPAWQEARYGKLWQQGAAGINQYNQINKVEPLQRAISSLHVRGWFAGLRREQSATRASLPVLSIQRGCYKFLPIIDWTNRQIYHYLKANQLDYHPLWDQGYVSVGDVHTTRKWQPGMNEADTRFFGLVRECGLHKE
jgi:phosphoadenosine phosphosulfate reductase